MHGEATISELPDQGQKTPDKPVEDAHTLRLERYIQVLQGLDPHDADSKVLVARILTRGDRLVEHHDDDVLVEQYTKDPSCLIRRIETALTAYRAALAAKGGTERGAH